MCQTPISVKNKTGQYVQVPCSKCPECLARRTSAWSFRLMQEEKISDSAHFLTLTYETEHLKETENGLLGLDKKHLQDFFKRLRQAHKRYYDAQSDNRIQQKIWDVREQSRVNKPIKYYAVGEYGTISLRPHYHIIIFNALLELIQPSWELGQVHYGTVTGASIGYTLKYISKKKQQEEYLVMTDLRNSASCQKNLEHHT